MVEYTSTFIENLTKKPEFKRIRELVSEAIELHYNGMLHNLTHLGKVTILEIKEEPEKSKRYLGFKALENEKKQTKRLERLSKVYSEITTALISCGWETPADDRELYSKIIRPIFEYQVRRSL